MNKKTLIIMIVAILIIALGAGGYFYWSKKAKTKSGTTKTLEQISDTAQKVTESATKGVLPSLETNPLENKPDLNPADKANPYKNIKTNPF